MIEADLAGDDSDVDRGISRQSWLALCISNEFYCTNRLNPIRCLAYAQQYGVEAEKNLIASLMTQQEQA